MWSYAIHDTRTGAHLIEMKPSAFSWSRRLVGTGTGSVSFKVLGMVIDRAVLRDLLRPTARTVIAKWRTPGSTGEPHVVFAGMVTDTSYAPDTGTLTANLTDIRTIFSKRMTGGVNQYGTPWNLTYTNRSNAGAIRAVLARAMAPSTEWSLPIDLPADGTGVLSRQVDFFETMTIGDLLSEIEDVGGVTVDFRPYLASGVLRWEVRAVGPSTTYGTTDLPVTVKESRVTGLTVAIDGKAQVTGVLALGNGTGEDMLTAYAPTSGSGATTIPVRDEKRTAKDLKSAASLQRFADAEYTKWSVTREQWTFSMQVDDVITPAHVQPGRLLRMDVRNDPWLPDGVRSRRVIALSGDMTRGVKPEVDDVD